MHIVERISRIERFYGKTGLTIGNFEGFHRGHQEIIRRLVSESKKRGCFSSVITFKVHPLKVLGVDDPDGLTVPSEKIRLFRDAGVDLLIYVDFTRALAGMQPGDFIGLLNNSLAPRLICLGKRFRFGRDNAGDVRFLEKIEDQAGFDLVTVREVLYGGIPVSSTRIRSAVKNGDFNSVGKMLGRAYTFYFIAGGNGSNAFPLKKNAALPRRGVYNGELSGLSNGKSVPASLVVENGEARIMGDGLIDGELYGFAFSG